MTHYLSAIGSAPAAVLPTAAQDQPKTIEAAAKQFEAILIGQMLRAARESTPAGLSGEESDSSSETMLDVADQQFSKLLANNGGLGLASMITSGLQQSAKKGPS